MSIRPPTIGDRGTCDVCGGAVEYVGPYWRHVEQAYRHPVRVRDGSPVYSARPAAPAGPAPVPQVCSHVGLGMPPPGDPIT